MIRRVFTAFVALFVCVSLTACTAPDKPKVPPVTTTAMEEPPSIENPLIVVSDVIDTTNFAQPASVNAWWVGGEPYYAVVTIELSQDDWKQFLEQVDADPSTDPAQIQMSEATARSLIDLDALADDIDQHFEKMGDQSFDIREGETYYDMAVTGL